MVKVYDAQGVVVAVQVPTDEYEELVDASEELEDTERFYAAVAANDERVPFRRRTKRQLVHAKNGESSNPDELPE